MNEHELASASDSDAKRESAAKAEQQDLWDAVEGKNYGWGYVLRLVIGPACAFAGLLQVIFQNDLVGLGAVALGVGIASSAMINRQGAQIAALRELLRHSYRREL